MAVALVAALGAAGAAFVVERSGPNYPYTLAPKSASPGAAALLDPANQHVVWSDLRSTGAIRPLPKDAVGDRPAFYDDGSGCQIANGNAVPKVCVSGDEHGAKALMLVGDSKIAQWQPGFSDLGHQQRWRVLSSTKRSCPFVDASITGHNTIRADCRDWGRATLKDILREKPDVVVTSQVFDTALPAGTTDGQDRSQAAMIGGLHSYWKQIQDAGIQVVVLLDNPMPTTHPVYQCVEHHAHELTYCAYSLARALPESAAPMQLKAVAATPGVRVMDMAPTYCPGLRMCPAVIGNVLVYRAGSHLTKTFVVSAETQLASELARATRGDFGR